MTPRQAQQYLESFINYEIQPDRFKTDSFKLDRMRALLNSLGDPQKQLKIIHVAGSKGKGSVCALTANILQSAGYSVGLYTSPHIDHYRERIRILRPAQVSPIQEPGSYAGLDCRCQDIFPDMITEEGLCSLLDETKPKIESVRIQDQSGALSFFEVITALAFYYFYQNGADFAVVETGVGGRLDATNAADSIMGVITPISLEHTHILGSTEEVIAREKAAIIKNKNQRVVIAPQIKSVKAVIDERCRPFGITPRWTDQAAQYRFIGQSVDGQVFDLVTEKAVYKNLSLPLLGKHQRENCAVAVSMIEELRELAVEVPLQAVYDGIKSVFWPGRFEIVKGEPVIVLDGAHNGSSVKVLSAAMNEIFFGRNITCILGVSQDKDKEAILNVIQKLSKNIIFTKADHPRAFLFPNALTVRQALTLALEQSAADDVILVTGSLFVVREARKLAIEIKNTHGNFEKFQFSSKGAPKCTK